MFALLLLIVSSAMALRAPQAVTLKRQVLYNRDDGQRLISVSASGDTTDAAHLHALLVFSGERTGAQRQYHNALLLNPRRATQYAAVTSTQHQLTVLSKGVSFEIKYAYTNETFATATPEYDALLSLDYDSSIWNEYDTALFEQRLLTLRCSSALCTGVQSAAAGVDTVGAASHHDPDEDVQDYLGVYKLECAGGLLRGGHDECVVLLDASLLVNGEARPLNGTALVVDLDSAANLLPLDLYNRWRFHNVREFLITEADSGDTVLLLNAQFQWQLNEESDDIVLGIDLVHHFQRVSYSAHGGRLLLWYSRVYAAHANFELSKQLIYWFISLILTCLSSWLASPNYDVLGAVLARRQSFDYPFQIVIVELVALVLAPLLWTLVLASGDAWTNAWAGFRHSTVLQREQLIFFLALYHWILALALYARAGFVVKQAFRHYYYYFKSFVTKRGRQDAALAARETESVSVKLVMLRNLAGHTLMNTCLLLICNYLAEEKLIYNVPFIIASLALLFFYLKTLLSAAVYVTLQGDPLQEPLFSLLCLVSAAAFMVYGILSTHLNYIGVFLLLNGVYSTTVIHASALVMLSFVGTAGILSVYLPVVKHASKRLKASLKKD